MVVAKLLSQNITYQSIRTRYKYITQNLQSNILDFFSAIFAFFDDRFRDFAVNSLGIFTTTFAAPLDTVSWIYLVLVFPSA
jgi:hypothetical protein